MSCPFPAGESSFQRSLGLSRSTDESASRSLEAFLPEVDLLNVVKTKGLTSPEDNQVELRKSTCFGYLVKVGGMPHPPFLYVAGDVELDVLL